MLVDFGLFDINIQSKEIRRLIQKPRRTAPLFLMIYLSKWVRRFFLRLHGSFNFTHFYLQSGNVAKLGIVAVIKAGDFDGGFHGLENPGRNIQIYGILLPFLYRSNIRTTQYFLNLIFMRVCAIIMNGYFYNFFLVVNLLV